MILDFLFNVMDTIRLRSVSLFSFDMVPTWGWTEGAADEGMADIVQQMGITDERKADIPFRQRVDRGGNG